MSESRIAEIRERLAAMLDEEEALMDEARDLGDPTFAPLTPEEQARIVDRARHVIDAVVLRQENARLRDTLDARDATMTARQYLVECTDLREGCPGCLLIQEISRLREENARLRADIEAHGGRPCDIPACNCGRTHWPACGDRADELARLRVALSEDAVEECARGLFVSEGWTPMMGGRFCGVLHDDMYVKARAVLAVLRRRAGLEGGDKEA